MFLMIFTDLFDPSRCRVQRGVVEQTRTVVCTATHQISAHNFKETGEFQRV